MGKGMGPNPKVMEGAGVASTPKVGGDGNKDNTTPKVGGDGNKGNTIPKVVGGGKGGKKVSKVDMLREHGGHPFGFSYG